MSYNQTFLLCGAIMMTTDKSAGFGLVTFTVALGVAIISEWRSV